MSERITNAEKAKAARREVQMRGRVYPRRVAEGRMTQADADRQTAVMTAIAEDYERLAAADLQAERPTLL